VSGELLITRDGSNSMLLQDVSASALAPADIRLV